MEFHEGPEVIFSLVYVLFSICFVFTPKEFASAGLTVQNIFSSYLGSEELDFVGYQIRRTTVTFLAHSFIPIGYYIGLTYVSEDLDLLNPAKTGKWAVSLLLASICSFLTGILIARYWSWKNWKFHPLCQILAKHGSTWRGVASTINIEFRRIEKFSSVTGATNVYVTDSWIIKCTAYFVHAAQQTDAHLSISESAQYALSHDTRQPAQYLNIIVYSINSIVKPFSIRLNSLEYSDLKDRLNAPIRNARNIVIQQSLSDRFLDAFKEQVSFNRIYLLPVDARELDNCIGCMQKTCDVKLQKNCAPSGEGSCMECYCRPMWCLECMGKWYASRQDQNEPERWMESSSPCPTCRAKFCMLDVCRIVN